MMVSNPVTSNEGGIYSIPGGGAQQGEAAGLARFVFKYFGRKGFRYPFPGTVLGDGDAARSQQPALKDEFQAGVDQVFIIGRIQEDYVPGGFRFLQKSFGAFAPDMAVILRSHQVYVLEQHGDGRRGKLHEIHPGGSAGQGFQPVGAGSGKEIQHPRAVKLAVDVEDHGAVVSCGGAGGEPLHGEEFASLEFAGDDAQGLPQSRALRGLPGGNLRGMVSCTGLASKRGQETMSTVSACLHFLQQRWQSLLNFLGVLRDIGGVTCAFAAPGRWRGNP